jgi:CRP/FNR family transcriptional regulator, cyclic AMP receptor protein
MKFMNSRSLVTELRSVALFQECGTRELRQIARLGTSVEVPAGRVLCVEGAIGAEFFVIVRGSAWVDRCGQRIAYLGPGQAFGEIALLSRNGRCRRTATVVAADPMTVLVFSRAEFNTLIRDVPAVARRLLESVSTVALSIAAERILQATSRDHMSNTNASETTFNAATLMRRPVETSTVASYAAARGGDPGGFRCASQLHGRLPPTRH